jgi:hypothetical protein
MEAALSNVADTETVVAPHAPLVDTPAPTTTTTPLAPTTALAVDTPVPEPATTTVLPVLAAAPAPMVAPDATLAQTTTAPPAPAPTPVSNSPAPINTAEITSHSSAAAGGVDSKPTDTLAPAPAPSTTAIAGSSSLQISQDEPQSTLTKKFTVDEWKALVEFRVCVFKLPKCVQDSGACYYRMNCPPSSLPRSLTSKSPKLRPRRLLSGGSV